MKYILLVTWISGGQPPVNYQTLFNSAEACEAARQAVLADAQRVKQQQVQEGGQMGALLAMQLRCRRSALPNSYGPSFNAIATIAEAAP